MKYHQRGSKKMKYLIRDIWAFLSSLAIIDYILYFAVLVLIILIISLIYIMRNSEEEPITNEEMTEDNEINLKEIVKTIDECPKPVIDMTAYETEQEEKAIISYDELLKTASHPLQYDDEEIIDNEIKVKKINIDAPYSKETKEPISTNHCNLFSYEKEEAFLNALKQLNELLN